MLDMKVLPDRVDNYQGPARVFEAERARELAEPWAQALITVAQAEAWRRLHRYIPVQVAADLQRNVLSPNEAAERLRYGWPNKARATLAEQVMRGDVSAQQAACEYTKANARAS